MTQLNFSIIIPHYNNAKLLNRLIESIPKREDLEIIIVDDCSTEDLQILENLRNIYTELIWISTTKNIGGGGARNLGLKYATGNWIIFADSDDYFTDEFNDSLDRYLDHEADMIFYPIKALNFDGKEYTPRVSEIVFEYIYKNPAQIKYLLPQPWAKFIKRDLIRNNNIEFEETEISNDVMFSTLCDFYSKKIIIDSTPIYTYHRNPDSIQNRKNVNKVLLKHEIICRRNKFLRSNHIIPKDYKCLVIPNIKYIVKIGCLQDSIKMTKILLKFEPTKAFTLIFNSFLSILKEKKLY